MPRQARSSALFSNTVHIITHSNNDLKLFFDETDYKFYLKLLREARVKFRFHIHHYALMTNHIHLLCSSDDLDQFSKIMHWINLKYSLYHKRKTHRRGHLWQERYKTVCINSDPQLQVCGVYIDLNPVRAGVVQRPEDYKWTSYNVLTGRTKNSLIEPDQAWLGLHHNPKQRPIAYKEIVDIWMKIPRNIVDEEMYE